MSLFSQRTRDFQCFGWMTKFFWVGMKAAPNVGARYVVPLRRRQGGPAPASCLCHRSWEKRKTRLSVPLALQGPLFGSCRTAP